MGGGFLGSILATPQELVALQSAMIHPDSVLSPLSQQACAQGFLAASAGTMTVAEAVSQVGSCLQRQAHDAWGEVALYHGDQETLDSWVAKTVPGNHWIHRLLAENPEIREADSTGTIRTVPLAGMAVRHYQMPYEDVLSLPDPFRLIHLSNGILGPLLGLKNLIDRREPHRGELIAHWSLLPVPVFLGAFHYLYGDRAYAMRPSAGLDGGGKVRAQVERYERPLFVGTYRPVAKVHNVTRVLPYGIFKHDLAHTLSLSYLRFWHPDFPPVLLKLDDLALSLFGEKALSQVRPITLDGPSLSPGDIVPGSGLREPPLSLTLRQIDDQLKGAFPGSGWVDRWRFSRGARRLSIR